MPRRKVTDSLRKIFEDMGQDALRERIIDYIIRELRRGRELDSILKDQYIVNRLTEHQQEHILQRTEIIDAVGKELEKAFDDLRDSLEEEERATS